MATRGFVPYIPPASRSASGIGQRAPATPGWNAVMGNTASVTWGPDSADVLLHTICIIQEAEDYIRDKAVATVFGELVGPRCTDERRANMAESAGIRGAVRVTPAILHTTTRRTCRHARPQRRRAGQPSRRGLPVSPGHVKRLPLFVDWRPTRARALKRKLADASPLRARIRGELRAQQERRRRAAQPAPRVIQIPGLGIGPTEGLAIANVTASMYYARTGSAGGDGARRVESLTENEAYTSNTGR